MTILLYSLDQKVVIIIYIIILAGLGPMLINTVMMIIMIVNIIYIISCVAVHFSVSYITCWYKPYRVQVMLTEVYIILVHLLVFYWLNTGK